MKKLTALQQANWDARKLDALLKNPDYVERLHACMTKQKASERPIRELAVGEIAYTLNWAFSLNYDCWKMLCFSAEGHTAARIQRTEHGFVFLDGDKKGTEITKS